MGPPSWPERRRGAITWEVTRDGPVSTVPLAVLEVYLWAQRRAGPTRRMAVAGLLLVATAATGMGVYGVVILAWLPKVMGRVG